MHIIIMIIMSQFFVGKNDWGGGFGMSEGVLCVTFGVVIHQGSVERKIPRRRRFFSRTGRGSERRTY